jgi:predicted PurR-regulated permease PerM
MPETFYTSLKVNLLGYVTFCVIGIILIMTNMLSFCILFLFFYLFSDVFINGIRRKFPAIPSIYLFWLFYVGIIGGCILVVVKIAPLFLSDFSAYYDQIIRDVAAMYEKFAARYGIITEFDVLLKKITAEGSQSFGYLFIFLKKATKGLVFIIFTLVLNILLYFEHDKVTKIFMRNPDSLLSYMFTFVSKRISVFYKYFRKVMGGQLIISGINTLLTLVIIVIFDLPHKMSLVSIVFLCGLLPIVGNIISNTVLALTALVASGPAACIVCLIFLALIHKLEYFLNSKIIGTITHLPMFMTLMALLLGEALLGVWGMMLAIPFILTIKDELESISA